MPDFLGTIKRDLELYKKISLEKEEKVQELSSILERNKDYTKQLEQENKVLRQEVSFFQILSKLAPILSPILQSSEISKETKDSIDLFLRKGLTNFLQPDSPKPQSNQP
jgi:cell shape-determining protein MreC